MLISDLIKTLAEIQKEHGDLSIGVENREYCTFYLASSAKVRELTKTGDYYTDDEGELGDYFVGIS